MLASIDIWTLSFASEIFKDMILNFESAGGIFFNLKVLKKIPSSTFSMSLILIGIFIVDIKDILKVLEGIFLRI